MFSKVTPFLILSGIGILLSGCNLAANRTKAGLQVFSKPASNLYINGKLVGLTPFLDHQLQAGYYQLKVATESASWSAKVKLTPGTITIVNRQFLPSVLGGEVLHLEKGDDLAVVSTPNGADLVIDNKLVGKSPLVYKEISPGEHRLIVSAPGFQSRSIVFQIHKGYRTVINVDLMKEDSTITSQNSSPSKQVLISQTPTGWLRVRDLPSVSANEIGRVYTGEKYQVLDKADNWIKIILNDNQQGWISAEYVIEN